VKFRQLTNLLFGRGSGNNPMNAGFDDTPFGVIYRTVYAEKQQPDPGSGSFALESFALPAFTPIGAGNLAVINRLLPFGPPPMISQQGARVIGIPTTAGQIVGQPLINTMTPTPGQV
jgi:hypothetical protein